MLYRSAPEIEEVAEGIIEQCHEHLEYAGIEYVMTDKESRSKGRAVYGRVRLISGLNAFLAGIKPAQYGSGLPFFVIEVAQPWWQVLRGEGQREGLVDHLLSHCRRDEETEAWMVVPPEYGEFPEVLKRRGFWRPGDSLKEMAEVLSGQLSLLPPEEDRNAGEEEASGENLQVSITHNGRTVETDTETMNRMAAGEVPSGVGS